MIGKNLFLTSISFLISALVSFFLAPYVIRHLGVEAYGFVSLGTQFVNYAAIAGIAINSMASRFISIEIHNGNWKSANKYFSSVLIANLIFVGIIILPCFALVYNLDELIKIKSIFVEDVQILFVFLFINYFIVSTFSAFSISTFVTNKLYLKSFREIEGRILYAGLLILLFNCTKPSIFFIGMVTCISATYTAIFNVYYLTKFLPQIHISLRNFSPNKVKELISSGIWNTVIYLGLLLNQGLDLLVVNLLLGPVLMGTLSLSKLLPVMFISFIGTIDGAFAPTYTKYYATNNSTDLLAAVRYSMKLLGLMVNVPVAVFAAFGESFYQLWLPTQNATELHQLSLLAMLPVVISGPINSLYGIFTATNRVKYNALVVVITGLFNFAAVWFLLTQFKQSMFTVVVVSLVSTVARNLLFTAPYGAKCLELPWYAFYRIILKSLLAFLFLYSLTYVIKPYVEIDSYGDLVIISAIFLAVGLLLNVVVVFDADERKLLIRKFMLFRKAE